MKKSLFILPVILLICVVLFGGWYLLYGRSSATLSVEGESVTASFKISRFDEKKVSSFSQSLGVDDSWQKGIRVSIDSENAKKLSIYSPQKVYLSFSDKKVKFKSLQINRLQRPALGKESLAIDITDPLNRLNEATSSGEVNLSNKIKEPLWNLASRIDRIKVQLDKDNLEGEITLK